MLILQPRDSDIRDYAVEIDTLAEHSLDHNILAVDKDRRDVQQIRRLPTGNVEFLVRPVRPRISDGSALDI